MFLKHWDLSNFWAILSWPRKYATLLLLNTKHYLSKVRASCACSCALLLCTYNVTKRQLQSMCAVSEISHSDLCRPVVHFFYFYFDFNVKVFSLEYSFFLYKYALLKNAKFNKSNKVNVVEHCGVWKLWIVRWIVVRMQKISIPFWIVQAALTKVLYMCKTR
jgi:hypothetical protein